MEGETQLANAADPKTQLEIVSVIKSAAPTRLAKVSREIIAIAYWLYVIIKLFVFDFDVYVAQKLFPNEAWLLNIKFIILLCTAAIIVLLCRSFSVVVWITYVAFYPLIVLFWKMPRWLYKKRRWLVAFAALNAIVAFFRSIKYNLVVSALALIAVVVAFEAANPILLWLAGGLLLLILLLTYVRRFIFVFRTNLLLQIYVATVVKSRESRIASYKLAEDLRNLPVTTLNEAQLKVWAASLEKPVLYNRLCLFAAKTLRTYQQSGMSFIIGVLTVLMMVIGTTFAFAVINLALFKIDPAGFDAIGAPSFFKFIYYSFNTFVFSGIKEIAPAATVTEAVLMIERFLAIFLIGIFSASMVTVRSQRNTDQINTVIAGLEEDGRITENFIREEYRIDNIDQALVELERLKAGLTLIMAFLTRSLKY